MDTYSKGIIVTMFNLLDYRDHSKRVINMFYVWKRCI